MNLDAESGSRTLNAARALIVAPVICLAYLTLGVPSADAAEAPNVESAWSSEVLTTSARVEGAIDPGGVPTLYHFDYIVEAAFEANLNNEREGFAGAARAPAGSEASLDGGTAMIVGQRLLGLSPETAYRYRLVAHSDEGAATSETLTFVTQAVAPIACEGDSCQILPPEPVDPALDTLIPGPGNPKVRYRKLRHRRGHRRHSHHKRHHGPHRRRAGCG